MNFVNDRGSLRLPRISPVAYYSSGNFPGGVSFSPRWKTPHRATEPGQINDRFPDSERGRPDISNPKVAYFDSFDVFVMLKVNSSTRSISSSISTISQHHQCRVTCMDVEVQKMIQAK